MCMIINPYRYKATPAIHLINLIEDLGYTVNEGMSVRKIRTGQVYAGLINIADTGIDYKIAFDSNGFLSATSSLYNTSDVLQGTVQSLLIDNSYDADWVDFYNQTSSGGNNFEQNTQASRPRFAVNGMLDTWTTGNVGLYLNSSVSYMTSTVSTVKSQPITIIGVVKDFDYYSAQNAVFTSGLLNDSLQIVKNYSADTVKVIESGIAAVGFNTGGGTIPDTGLCMIAIGLYENNIGTGNHDVRFWFNGVMDSEIDDPGNMQFSANSQIRIGRAYVSGYYYQAKGHLLEHIYVAGLITNDDMTIIYNNINASFEVT